VFQSEADIECLRLLADKVTAVSFVCHEYPKDIPKSFFDECKSFGWNIYHLVGRCHGNYETSEEMEKTLSSLMKNCLEKGLDGLDFDLEFEPAHTKDAYSAYLRRAAEELHSVGKRLSVCVGYHPAAHAKPADHGFIDPDVIGQVCDEVRVMCYDQYFAPAKGKEPLDRLDCQGIGPTSSQPWAAAAMAHWSQYVPKEKLVMGLPTHSNDYDARHGGGGRAIYTSVPPANIFSDKSWLWYEKINLYRYKDEDGGARIFYASDADSTRAHLDTADDIGVNKISFWQGRAVDPEMWKVAKAWLVR